MRYLALAASLLLFAAPCRAAEPMNTAAAGFYGVYQALHAGGVPEDADRAKFAPFVTPALEALLKQAADAEKRFMTANKGSPPLIEGDLFSSLFEGATAFRIGACTGDARKGSCAVALTYTDGAHKPTGWTDTVYLLNTPSGWRVDDIGYGGSWAFGNKGRLSETLKQVIAFQ